MIADTLSAIIEGSPPNSLDRDLIREMNSSASCLSPGLLLATNKSELSIDSSKASIIRPDGASFAHLDISSLRRSLSEVSANLVIRFSFSTAPLSKSCKLLSFSPTMLLLATHAALCLEVGRARNWSSPLRQ